MPRRPTPGRGNLFAEVPVELLDRYKAFVAERGESLTSGLCRALTRDMAYPAPKPEPPPIAPLPDGDPAQAKKGRGRPKKDA